MLINAFEMDARRRGFKEGFQKGLEQSLIKIIVNMRRKNYDNEFISEITGLSVEEIEKL